MKKIFNSIFVFLLLSLFTSIHSTVLVKAKDEINFECDKNIYYISIKVIFSEKPPKDYYSFNLNLASPEKLNFKCMLDYPESKIFCFRAFSDELDYIEEETLFQFPYPFPELENIEWDYESFLQKIYRRVWNAKSSCGGHGERVPDEANSDWSLKGKITTLDNGSCAPASLTKEEMNKYKFDMEVEFNSGELFEKLNGAKSSEKLELLQEIWVPLLPPEESKTKTMTTKRPFSFAYCSSDDKINGKNIDKFKFNCYLPIDKSKIFNGVIRINPFFDRLYVRQGKKVNNITISFETPIVDEKTYISLDEKDHGIICPNQPVFTITTSDDITMGSYYEETNKYSFFLIGTLSNGYYAFKNGTTVELNSTYKDISFNLIVQDNFKEQDENDVIAVCVLPNNSPYQLKNEAYIQCIASKEKTSVPNKNVDIVLNWNLKANNNFKDIIINWPRSYDDVNKKNIYEYELTGLSIRQSNFGCHNNNFDFYVYIYNLGREPKLSFDLPLSSPKDMDAYCQIFDETALKCTLNLKHTKLSKGTQIALPLMGSKNEIDTDEGNRIIFTMNNYSQINNDHDFYVKTQESCGDYLVVGTLKDMGMSHKTSVIVYIIIIVFILLVIAGFVIYIICKIRLRYKRGKKLTTSEESKSNEQSVSK